MIFKGCPHCKTFGQMVIESEGKYKYLVCMPCGYEEPLNFIGAMVFDENISSIRKDGTFINPQDARERELELV